MPLLDALLDTLPGAQRNAIDALLEQLQERGNTTDLRKLSREVSEKVNEDPRGPTFFPIKVTPVARVSSQLWNDIQQRIYLDMVTMYTQVRAIDQQVKSQGQITQNELIRARSALHKIIQQVRVYQFLQENPEYQDVRFVDFIDGRNEADRPPRAKVDTSVQRLELPARRRARLEGRNVNLKQTTVTTENVGGGVAGGMIKDFKPENMLDGDPDTFWAEMVLADGVILQDYSASWGVRRSQGAIGEVKLKLSQTSRINNVRILPFGQFPVKIVDVAYKTSETDDHWETIPDFAVTESTLGWLEFDFSPRMMSEIIIVIEQPNYTRNIYHLPRKTAANHVFWEQVLDSKFDSTIHTIRLDTEGAGKVEADPSKLAHLNALELVNEELADMALREERTKRYELSSKLLDAQGKVFSETDPSKQGEVKEPVDGTQVPDNNDVLDVRKYEYMYGIRQIALNQVLYEPFAFYSSPKMNPGATVLSVELDTNEEHVTYRDPHGIYRRTSVEYEIAVADNQSFPILPANVANRTVQDEYIFVDRRTRTGWTRFPVDSLGAVVRRNGVRLLFSEYTLTVDSTKNGRAKLVVVPGAYDPNAVYTITYPATIGSTKLDLDANVVSTPLSDADEFSETDRNSSILLSAYPYIEREILNSSQWLQDDENDARWRFSPSQTDITSADGSTVELTDGSPIVIGTGTDFTQLDADKINVFRAKGDSVVYKIASIDSAVQITLEKNYVGSGTGIGYAAGEGVEIDGVLYGLNSNIYEPVQVFVNDQKAFNLTNYLTLEHQAFTPIQESGRRFQFIHAGRRLYFNTPIQGAKIEVFYSWRAQYLQLKAVLRSNIPVLTEVTPKLVDYKLKLKTTSL